MVSYYTETASDVNVVKKGKIGGNSQCQGQGMQKNMAGRVFLTGQSQRKTKWLIPPQLNTLGIGVNKPHFIDGETKIQTVCLISLGLHNWLWRFKAGFSDSWTDVLSSEVSHLSIQGALIWGCS